MSAYWLTRPTPIVSIALHRYARESRRIEIIFPDGQKFWTARDGLGRATEHYQGPHGSTAGIMTAFAYNAAGQRSYFARKYGDMTSYGYDAAGRLASQTDGFAGGIGSTQSAYAYNPAGQLRSESRSNDAYAWTGSVPVSRNYATNGQNQYTGTTVGGAPGATFTHDANGNLTASVNPPYSTSYAYDSENRLVSASGSENATLVYDPLGRLFQIHSTATGLTQFLYDGDELVAEYIGWGNLARRYIHGDESDDPLFWYEGPGLDQPRFPHTNHQGSVTAVAGAGAALLSINTYDEYGIPGANQRGVTALGTHGRFQYTGQAWIPELGLYYYKARFYSPPLGRFLQTDPIGYDDQINLYAYVQNDPVNGNDPTGNQSCRSPCADISRAPTNVREAAVAAAEKMPISRGNSERGAQVMVEKQDPSRVAEVRTGAAAGRVDPDNPMRVTMTPISSSDRYKLGADVHPHPRQADTNERNPGVRNAQQATDKRNRIPSRGDYEHMNQTQAPMFNKNTVGAITETYRIGGIYHTTVVKPGSAPLGTIPKDLDNVVID